MFKSIPFVVEISVIFVERVVFCVAPSSVVNSVVFSTGELAPDVAAMV